MRPNRPDEPSYAGVATYMKTPLVLDPKELKDVDVAILGAPVDDLVTYRPGARFGPREIRVATDDSRPEAWHLDLGIDPFAHLEVVDAGDVGVVPLDAKGNLERIHDATAAIAAADCIPIVLGGDHSISYATIKAVAAAHPGLAVLHFDTHADTAATNWGEKRAHGTPFRWLVDEGHIRGDRLVQIGLRGYWPGPPEFEWMRAAGVRWFRMEEVERSGWSRVIASALEHLSEAPALFLSVDVDVLDPAFAPGTGTPEPGGMSTFELLRMVRAAVLAKGIAGMDVVEVSPPYDQSQLTAMAAHRTVLEALSALAVHRTGRPPAPENP